MLLQPFENQHLHAHRVTPLLYSLPIPLSPHQEKPSAMLAQSQEEYHS